jgi:2-keto-3-deoxy-L-rhamnonate aldolase RhmA
MLASTLKEKVAGGQEVVGVMMGLSFWPGYLEICKKEGLDLVVLDLEHGALEAPRVEELCRTARLLDLPLLIRPQSCAADLVKRCVDIGAAGLMAPWVESAEQLDSLFNALYSPPRGRHGMGGPGIMAVDGIRSADWARLEDNLFVICQIETPPGLQFAPQVAACDWVDALMVGPYDLACTMGLTDQYLKSPRHLRAIEQVREAAHAHLTCAGMVTGTGEEARAWFDRGFDLILIGDLVGHLAQGLSQNLQTARPAPRRVRAPASKKRGGKK